MTDREEGFLRSRLPGGRLFRSGVVVQFVETVATLERLAHQIAEGPPERLAHVLGQPDTGDDRAAVTEACERLRAIADLLRPTR
jgi:hypothetical protein